MKHLAAGGGDGIPTKYEKIEQKREGKYLLPARVTV